MTKKIIIHIGILHKSLIPDNCVRLVSQRRPCAGDGHSAYIMILPDLYYVPLCETCASEDWDLTTELNAMTAQDVGAVEYANNM